MMRTKLNHNSQCNEKRKQNLSLYEKLAPCSTIFQQRISFMFDTFKIYNGILSFQITIHCVEFTVITRIVLKENFWARSYIHNLHCRCYQFQLCSSLCTPYINNGTGLLTQTKQDAGGEDTYICTVRCFVKFLLVEITENVFAVINGNYLLNKIITKKFIQ